MTGLAPGDVVHGRTVIDGTVRTLHERLPLAADTPRFVLDHAGPRVGQVVLTPGRGRYVVLDREVTYISADDLDRDTLAPDGEPQPGWILRLTGVPVTPTPEEIADDERAAAEDATHHRRAELRQRLRTLVHQAPDREPAADGDPAARRALELAPVPTGDLGPDGLPAVHADILYLDPDASTLWLSTPDVDGGARLLSRMPSTPDRRALVDELRREYDPEHWARQGVTADAAAVLIAAGWSATRPLVPVRIFRLADADDARALLTRTPTAWDAAGWHVPFPPIPATRFAPADAARLADAALTYRHAHALTQSGHRDIDALLAATPPPVPDAATRILIQPRRPGIDRGWLITDDPAAARAWLDQRPEHWDATVVADHARIVHAEPGWALTDTGEITRAHWITAPNPTSTPRRARPRSLTPAAVHALTLLTRARRADTLLADRAAWHPLRDALTHTATTIDDHTDRTSSTHATTRVLIRHDYQLADGATHTRWQVHVLHGGLSHGEGDVEEYYTLHTNDHAARQAWHDAT
ncbi:hypothetical protein ACWDSJ_27725 [Nocardia sp. NPDC003482]